MLQITGREFSYEEVARIAHQVNKAYCQAMGDDSQLDWEEAPDWAKESAINGVRYAIEKNFPSPQEMHDNWLSEKLKNGWKYGEEKDADKKEHPCCLPYKDLPEFQKAKDYLFSAVVRSMYEAWIKDSKLAP
jgi:hypothetical protein